MDFIPVIDLAGIADKPIQTVTNDISSSSSLFSIAEEEYPLWNRVASEIKTALSGIGFMYLKNHGIPEDVVSNLCSCNFVTLSQDNFAKMQKKIF